MLPCCATGVDAVVVAADDAAEEEANTAEVAVSDFSFEVVRAVSEMVRDEATVPRKQKPTHS